MVPAGQRQGRQHLHPQPLARASCRPSGASRTASCRPTTRSTPRPEQQGLARLAVLRRRRRHPGRRRLLPDPGPGRRRHQRRRSPAGDQGARVRRASRSTRSPRRPRSRPRRDARPGGRDVRLAQARLQAVPELETKVVKAIEVDIGKIARPTQRLDRHRHAQDPLRQDHAPGIAAISNRIDVGDITTLANPDIVEQIRKQIQG